MFPEHEVKPHSGVLIDFETFPHHVSGLPSRLPELSG